MAGLFFLITIGKLIVKIRLYTVFESFWSFSHPEITTTYSLEFILWLIPYIFILFHFVFIEMGSYYKSCTAVSPMPDQQPGHHPELVRNADSQASLMTCWITTCIQQEPRAPGDSGAHQSWSSNTYYHMQLAFFSNSMSLTSFSVRTVWSHSLFTAA